MLLIANGHGDPAELNPTDDVRCHPDWTYWPAYAILGRVPRLTHRVARLALCSALIVLASVTVAIPVHAQSDGNGLEESSTNTFQIDASTGTVRVTVEIFLRNVTPDRREGDYVRQTYFDAYGVVVPVGAENIVATRNGSALSGDRVGQEEGDAFSLYQFDLGTRLFNEQSTSIVVTYDHLGQPPRSELLWRANAAYASFLAFGLGDSGSITINVVLPFGYEFDEFTDLEGFVSSAPDAFGSTIYTRTDVDEDFATIISLSNDDLLTSTPLDVPGAQLELRSWPDDPEWAAFAKEKIESGVPELEELIGTPWPLDRQFDIRETVEPNFSGYAGWFDTQASEIAVGEDLDANTLYHELSHAWFNRDVFDSRWLSEGFASLYAAEMIARDGDTRPEPTTPPLSGLGRQPLSQWTNYSADDDTEAFGYNAAHYVMDAVADDIGFDALADVLAAVRGRSIAYPATPNGDGLGDGAPEKRSSSIIDWRHMLDYFEFVGGSTVADEVFREYVVVEGDLDELTERSAAIETYDELAQQLDPWLMPIGIRERMDIWAFQRATSLQAEATEVIALRSSVDELANDTGVAASTTATAAAADAFAAAEDDFDAVVTLLESEIADGESLVDVQATIAERSAVAKATPPALATLDGIDGFASVQPFAEDQISALDAVVSAADAADEPRSLTDKIGLLGTDVDGDLSAARDAVVAGDNDAARAFAAQATQTLDDAGALGTSRLTKGLAALVALFGAVVFAVLFRHRRRNQQSSSHDVVVARSDAGNRNIDLDEDALTRAGLSGVNDVGDVAVADPGQAAGAAGVIEGGAVLGDVRDAVFELDENVGTVIDADSVAGAEVLIDPNTHDERER